MTEIKGHLYPEGEKVYFLGRSINYASTKASISWVVALVLVRFRGAHDCAAYYGSRCL